MLIIVVVMGVGTTKWSPVLRKNVFIKQNDLNWFGELIYVLVSMMKICLHFRKKSYIVLIEEYV